MLIALLDLAMYFTVNTLFHHATREASRVGTLSASGGAQAQAIADEINERMLGLLTVSASNVSAQVYPDFSSVQHPEPFDDNDNNFAYNGPPDTYDDLNNNGVYDGGNGTSGYGSGGEIVLYTVVAHWPLVTPYLSDAVGGTLIANMTVRNEDF